MSRFLLSLLFIICLSDAGYSQSRWIQCFVDGLESESDCRSLEEMLAGHEGVESVRSESVHGNLLIFLDPEASVTLELLEEWIEESGKEIWCYRTGVRGVDPIIRISRTDCETQEHKHE